MGLLDRKTLLTREKLEIVKVELGDDDFVFVRQMTGRERDHFEQSLIKEVKNKKGEVISYDKSLEDFRAKLAVNVMCNENGDMIMEHGDYGQLSRSMSAYRLEKIVNVAQKINAITEEDKETIVKNLEAVQDGSSVSDSVEN